METTAPPPSPKTRHFPCPSCGADVVFDPAAGSLKCPYCGFEQAVPQSEEQVRELDYEMYFQTGRLPQAVLSETCCEVSCQACGATVELPPNVAAGDCPFCGTHITNPVHDPEPLIQPQGLLPFSVDRTKALQNLREWLNTRWFAPNGFKKMAVEGKIEGIYVPYWTYDSMTYSFYTGQRGEAYYVTVKGPNNQTRQERRVRWYAASGRVSHFFDDVLVLASKGLPPKYARKLAPWDLQRLSAAQPHYLAGFRTERYAVSAQEGFVQAKAEMDAYIQTLVRRDIGGDEQRIHSVKTDYRAITFKHILLPVWAAVYRYHEKVYRVLINARTGQVQGERPWSVWKITLLVVVAIAIAVGVGALSQR